MALTTRSLWVAVIVLNLSLVVLHSAFVAWRARVRPSYIGDDFPIAFDPGHLDAVGMTLYDSIYLKVEPGNEDALKRWRSTIAHPHGQGRVHMGPNDRIFSTTFAHQLHCLTQMQQAFPLRNSSKTHGHVQHCLNYLRQTLLCAAADSLEKGDFMDAVSNGYRVDNTLVCWDWGKLYSDMDDQWLKWIRRRKSSGT